MKWSEIKKVVDGTTLGKCSNPDQEFIQGCGSDLMSDVLAYIKEESLLLTGLVNEQVVRTAEMVDVKGILFVRGKIPNRQVIDLADEKGIGLLSTKLTMYMACGELYKAGLKGYCIEKGESKCHGG